MITTSDPQKPIRVGVFSSVPLAQDAIEHLLQAGFDQQHITVVSSDEAQERFFSPYVHQHPAGRNLPLAIGGGVAIGALTGGLGAWAVGAIFGGDSWVGGGLWVMAGGVIGGFVGAMMTRGGEKELANFYDQAVVAGKILVAAEAEGEGAETRLKRAEQILTDEGVEPSSLPAG